MSMTVTHFSGKGICVGDEIVVRAEVLEHIPGVGVRVELFSKTDQYDAWVREDLIFGRLVDDNDIPPEPETGWVFGTDDYGQHVAFRRDGMGAPLEPARREPRRWWDVASHEWVDWRTACRRGADAATARNPASGGQS